VPLCRIPSPPPERPVSGDVQSVSRTAMVAEASEAEMVAPPATTSEIDRVWQVLLDIAVWRSRPWWWRLAASLVVKRLGR
jgi:hypothetical protein